MEILQPNFPGCKQYDDNGDDDKTSESIAVSYRKGD